MLIAIMSDSYERVMANKIPANCRQVASMLLELEQIVNFLNIKLRGNYIKNDYKFIIYSQLLTNSEATEWDGMVGEMRNIIEKEIKSL